MTWCNDSDEERGIQLLAPTITPATNNNTKQTENRTITCPSCGHNIEFQDQVLKKRFSFYLSPPYVML